MSFAAKTKTDLRFASESVLEKEMRLRQMVEEEKEEWEAPGRPVLAVSACVRPVVTRRLTELESLAIRRPARIAGSR